MAETSRKDRPRIRVLPPELASQIAAGEVVERPASVVKELVENAVDAGAQRVDVLIEGGGRERIRVVDNGCGMTAGDIRLALKRHATSKLRCVEDLAAIETLGFRGEALPSIAAVSRMSITSRPSDAVSGIRCDAEPGREATFTERGCPVGTAVEVADLFFSVPARLKFLKKARTEAGHVAEMLLHLALARPDLHVTLTEDGRRSLDLPKHPGLLERAIAALGRRASGTLHPVEFQREEFRVEAVLGSPAAAVATARNVFLLVNGRGVRDRLLLRMLASGYGEILERGRYPAAVVHLHLPPGAVDMNVHPQKQEVRFAEEKRIAGAVHAAVATGVTGAPWARAQGVAEAPPDRIYSLRSAPQSVGADLSGLSPRRAPHGSHYAAHYARESTPVFPVGARDRDRPRTTAFPEVAPEVPADSLRRLRYLGQLFETYLLFEGLGELVLMDQHAAHERVTYGKVRAALASGEIPMQRLLFPVQVALSPDEEGVVREQAEALRRCGFEVALLSGRTAAIRGMPAPLAECPAETLFKDVAQELAASPLSETLTEGLDRVAATLACHGSVRAGQRLASEEVTALLEALEEVERSSHCPHGRPVLLRLGEAEIRRRLGRE